MSALAISLIAFAFVFCGALLGMYVRTTLPEGHLRDDVKDVVEPRQSVPHYQTRCCTPRCSTLARSSWLIKDAK